jgi:regulator of cell morphogenesis and NO signaling
MDKFSKKMKFADLISANYNLILTLPRFGISLGFGDKSVAEVCMKHRVPTDFFLLISNVYSFDDYIPDKKEVETTDMQMLIPYLMASHRYYLNERLPHIEEHLNRIVDSMDDKYGKALKRFFIEYKNEVSEHFIYEEKTVFPYIKSLISGKQSVAYRIRDFEHAHNNIEDKLNDMMQIIFKYLPDNVPQTEAIGVVFDIFRLSSDLHKHSLIEDKALVPYVKLLEKRLI